MIILRAKPGDSEKILHLVRELRKLAYLEMGSPVPKQLVSPISKKFLIKLFKRSDTYIFVAKEMKKIVGFCLAIEIPKIADGKNRIEILELFIDEKYRGKGIGSEFLHKIEGIAQKKGLHYVKVATGTEMKSNEFYRKNGYIHFENLYRKKVG